MAIIIRVYGILINEKKEVLLSDERRFGQYFTKFPGGGLEFGEGTKDCLIREFKEELNLEIQVGELLYFTDFFQPSAFNDKDQIISVYYRVIPPEKYHINTTDVLFSFEDEETTEVFRWKKLIHLTIQDVTFPIDKLVVELIKKTII